MAAGMAWVIDPNTWLFHWFLYSELAEGTDVVGDDSEGDGLRQ